MIEPSLALQKAVASRLKSEPAVLALVPAASIADRHGLPTLSPCVIIGADQTIREPISLADRSARVVLSIHVWVKGQSLVAVKQLAGAVAVALRLPLIVDGHRVVQFAFSQTQFMRDPGGEWGHGVMTFESLVVETA